MRSTIYQVTYHLRLKYTVTRNCMCKLKQLETGDQRLPKLNR